MYPQLVSKKKETKGEEGREPWAWGDGENVRQSTFSEGGRVDPMETQPLLLREERKLWWG